MNKLDQAVDTRKTYVIMVSPRFLATHPKAGKPTYFPEKIETRDKKTTFRTNYPYWEKRLKAVNEGKAILSIRMWAGLPRKSEQIEIAQVTEVEYERVEIIKSPQDNSKQANLPNGIAVRICVFFDSTVLIDDLEGLTELARMDGLSFEDFRDWFSETITDGIRIHFKQYNDSKK